ADQRVNGMDFYTEFEERIRLLKDVDGDGVFETASIVADGFNDPLDGTAAGLLVIDGDLWFTCIPSLWRLQDADTDGIAEIREEMFRGFGVRVALRGHDLHGLALGLDGRLYWSMGDRGYHIELDNGSVLHSPGEGGVFRCELDGTNLELYHHGLRNPQELAFDKYGNLFTGDNNSDAGDKARLVYCVEGGETGWRMEYQTLEGENKRGPWMQENGWDPHAKERPAWILPAIDTIGSGPSGLVAYPGAGLSQRYDNHFFLCNFLGSAQHSNVLSFEIKPDGAHFTMVDLHPFVENVLCTDVDFGYNGKMVISDWGEGWKGNYEGRLYSVWDEKHVSEGDVSAIFENGFATRTKDDLKGMLSHTDRRVRLRAQIELANRNEVSALHSIANQSNNQLARIHAMWGLAMIDRAGGTESRLMVPLLHDMDPEIRAQACKILGEANYARAFSNVTRLINDDSLRVSYFATIAAGHLGDPLDEVVDMIAENKNKDVYLRHAGVMALASSQYPSTLMNLSEHPSAAVRLAAVLALRKLESRFLEDFLYDEDTFVATEAARAIHDVPIQPSMKALSDSLQFASTEPWKRRALSAAQRLGTQENLENVISFASNSENSHRLRLVALDIIKLWKNPEPREIIEGRWRPVQNANARSIEPLEESIHILVEQTSGDLLLQVFEIAKVYELSLPKEINKQILVDESKPIELRVHCLRSLQDEPSVEYALQHDAWQLRAAARDVLLEMDEERAKEALLQCIEEGEMREAQDAIKTLARNPEGFACIDKETLPVELHLEYAHASGDRLMFGDPLQGWWLLRGGNPQRGKQVVYENSRSECMRCHQINDFGGIAGPPLDE
ncbi:PQQ-dependent sugar dehydrogenase, partial [bacterium]|nr:PQQ-dependent sugar dehydrogenase [bacterium]